MTLGFPDYVSIMVSPPLYHKVLKSALRSDDLIILSAVVEKPHKMSYLQSHF